MPDPKVLAVSLIMTLLFALAVVWVVFFACGFFEGLWRSLRGHDDEDPK